MYLYFLLNFYLTKAIGRQFTEKAITKIELHIYENKQNVEF